MASLYEINEEILNCVDMETGEIIDIERLEALQLSFDEKVENIGCWIKNLLSDAKALKEEKDNLYARQKACENKAASLKEYLARALGGEKFKTAKVSISYRKSESVEVEDLSKIPEKYLKYKDPEVDKTAVKNELKSGHNIPGVTLLSKQNIQIK